MLTFGSSHYFDLPLSAICHEKVSADQISCLFQRWNTYIIVHFWNQWSAKLQLQLPINFVIMCPPWMGTNIQPSSFSWPSLEDVLPWKTDESCVALIICNIRQMLSGLNGEGTCRRNWWRTMSVLKSYCKKTEEKHLLIDDYILLFSVCGPFFHTHFTFSFRLTSWSISWISISLTPYTKLTRKAEKYWLLPWLAPAKMSSLTSEHAVLLDWTCLPARLCQSQEKKKKKQERERKREA